MRALPDLHEQVVDVDAEGEVGVYERQHGRRRHDDRCPPGQHVRVVGECRRHGAHTERQQTLDDKSVAFVDGDVSLDLGQEMYSIQCDVHANNYCNDNSGVFLC